MRKMTPAFALICMALLGVWLTVAIGKAGVGAAVGMTPTLVPPPDPTPGALDLDAVAALDLHAYPPVPVISEHAGLIYRYALARGSDPHSFIKVGDCMTDNPYFLRPIGEGDYALGEYEHLEAVIDHFVTDEHNAFSRISQATAGGFNAASTLDSLWANPEFCEPGETPLACEMRIMQPSVALIMFGTNDVFYLDSAQFDFSLRSIVTETIRRDALPVLSTFPHRPEFPEKSVLYNQIVVQVALDYDIPLINLWRALETLPNQGIDPDDPTHLSAPPNGASCYFLGDNMQAGFTVRNLLTLETLAAVLQSSVAPET